MARKRWNDEYSAPRLIFASRYYPPAYLAGGPPRSVAALVDAVSSEYETSVLTSSRDLDGTRVHSALRERSEADLHLADSPITFARSLWRLTSGGTGTLHVNSFFDRTFGLSAILLGLFLRQRVIVAPRGELSPGALSIRPVRKRLTLTVLRWTRVLALCEWHATSAEEMADITQIVGEKAKSHLAPIVRELPPQPEPPATSDDVRIVFYSRVAPKKNLLAAIEAVRRLESATLTVIGPVDDESYADRCRKAAKDAGIGHRVDFAGAIRPEHTIDELAGFDLFILPTLGENFGHVIFESLAAGTPVLISETTPWSNVATVGAGYVIGADDIDGYVQAIERWRRLTADEQLQMRARARAEVERVFEVDAVGRTRAMLNQVDGR